MPIVNFAYTRGAVPDDEVQPLANRLLAILLKNHIVSTLSDQLAPVTVFKVSEMEPSNYLVAGGVADKPRYDIELVVPDGSVDGDRRDRMVMEMTEAVLAAEGTEWSEDDAHRVWILIRDVPDGRWAVGGKIVTARSILRYLIKMRRRNAVKESEPA